MAHSKAFQFETPYDVNHIISHYGKALSYPARVLIMRWLAAEGPKHAGEISQFIDLSKATTSHHLASLERAGIISGTEHGRHIVYEFNDLNFPIMRGFIDMVFDEVEAAAGIKTGKRG